MFPPGRPNLRTSLAIALYLADGTDCGLIRVLAGLALRPTLPEQVPALVEGGLELLKTTLLLLSAHGPSLQLLAKLVLFLDELGDGVQDVCVVHKCSSGMCDGGRARASLGSIGPRTPWEVTPAPSPSDLLLFDAAENALSRVVELSYFGARERLEDELVHGRDVGGRRGDEVLVPGLREDGVGVPAVRRVGLAADETASLEPLDQMGQP
jgi:hypothetical protein